MGKKSNGKLRRERMVERVIRKGLVDQVSDAYAYVYATDGSTLRLARRG